jgi:hypothetical protein
MTSRGTKDFLGDVTGDAEGTDSNGEGGRDIDKDMLSTHSEILRDLLYVSDADGGALKQVSGMLASH